MPIKPENRKRYPSHWKEIVARVRARSGNRCEWCGAENGKPHPETGSTVVLTTAHLDHNPESEDIERMAHLCQRDHLRYDAAHHAETARQTREKRIGQERLPP